MYETQNKWEHGQDILSFKYYPGPGTSQTWFGSWQKTTAQARLFYTVLSFKTGDFFLN